MAKFCLCFMRQPYFRVAILEVAAVLTSFSPELTPPIIQNETLSVMLTRPELQELLLNFHAGYTSPSTSLFNYYLFGLLPLLDVTIECLP